MKETIKKFLASGEGRLKLETMIPISEMDSLMQEFGYDELETDGDETNGWQIDFWYTWNKKDRYSYTLSGSLFYGGFVLSKNK
jgi:hypothetical protein